MYLKSIKILAALFAVIIFPYNAIADEYNASNIINDFAFKTSALHLSA